MEMIQQEERNILQRSGALHLWILEKSGCKAVSVSREHRSWAEEIVVSE